MSLRLAGGEVAALPSDVPAVGVGGGVRIGAVPGRAPCHGHREGRSEEDGQVPPVRELRPVQEDAVDEHHRALVDELDRQRDGLLTDDVVHGPHHPPVATGTQRVEQPPAQGRQVVGVEVEPLR
jgi:hypothetical protein